MAEGRKKESDNIHLEQGDAEDDEEELYEPKFKYKRILNDMTKIFNQDKASCFAVHEKFLALGTEWGRIYILDHMGNMLPNKVLTAHSVAVNQIAIDKAGDYLVSCSNDGKVFIYGLASTEFNQVVSMDRPIRSVGIDPNFSRPSSGQRFVTGDRVLVLHERGLFTRDKQQVVFAGKERDGFVHNISWQGVYIAFANDSGVRVYDRVLKSLITHVVPRHDASLRAELHPAQLCWLDAQSFCIGWASTLTICTVKENPVHVSSEFPAKLVEIRYMWDIPGVEVAGVWFTMEEGPALEWKELVLLCIPVHDNNQKEEERAMEEEEKGEEEVEEETERHPRVWLVEPVNFHEFDVVTEDIIEMRDAHTLLPHNYHLQGLADERIYFLLSCRDMIDARPCSADDHVDWLLGNGLFRKALDFAHANAATLHRFTDVEVGRVFLDHLIQTGQFQEAAVLCPQVCGKKKDAWEEYVSAFERQNQLKALAEVLPTRDPQLEPECYEMVLQAFLEDDVPGFKTLINDWSSDLYRVGALIKNTLEKFYQKNLDKETYNSLLCILGQLYTYERKYERALSIYLNLGDKSVFNLIAQYRLFPHVKDRIQELMAIDADLAVRLLLENEDSLPAATVMKQLSNDPKLQVAYLERLFSRNEGAEFADLAVSLFADHQPKRLLTFLRNSEHYKMDRALDICKKKGLIKEVVFLLGRGGNRREALRVIIKEQKDIFQAIEFCKEHDDPDLWRDLIQFGVGRAEFIRILMKEIGTYVDPLVLIRAIPDKLQIPDLPASLVKILHDYSLQNSLQEGTRRVTLADCHDLLEALMKQQKGGVLLGERTLCRVCRGRVLRQDARFASAVEVFGCGHSFHRACLLKEDHPTSSCPQCSSVRGWKTG